MKRNLILLLALAMAFASCQRKPKEFKVNVSLTNADQTMIYLQKYADKDFVVIDSATIVEGAATLTAPIEDIQTLYSLRVKDVQGAMPFFADNKDVSIIGDLKNPRDIKIIASETQTKLDDFRQQFAAFYDQVEPLYQMMEQAYNSGDSIALDSINKVGDSLLKAQGDFRDNFIRNDSTFLGHYLLDEAKEDYPLNELKAFVAGFGTKNTSIFLDEINTYIADMEKLEIGQPYIDFALQTADGKDVSLSESIGKNKLTLVDFWASWCNPCRAENPNVLAAYNKFHDKGFDVIGVSVDQKPEDWTKAVADDHLPWTQVRDTDHSVSDKYLIYYIPSNFLFDQNGKIVAKNLKGEELQAKLAEILK